MEISKKAVEKLQERTATANACGVRLQLNQLDVADINMIVMFLNDLI